MIELLKNLDRSDSNRLARLHVDSLPESLVSRLGVSYAKRFYRYLAGSKDEFVLVGRDGSEIASACVVSLDPASLNRRLVWHTGLPLWAALRFWRFPWLHLGSSAANGHETTSANRGQSDLAHLPELILIFTDANARGRGWGSELLARCEVQLSERGIFDYTLKTLDDPANRAIAFYGRHGFAEFERVRKMGKAFRVFRKTILRSSPV